MALFGFDFVWRIFDFQKSFDLFIYENVQIFAIELSLRRFEKVILLTEMSVDVRVEIEEARLELSATADLG